MMHYRIAFCIRPDYDNPLGGDGVQMLKTKQYLEAAYPLAITIITVPSEITPDCDLVHVFNFATYRFTRQCIDQANKLGIPVVSSCIYWDYSYASTERIAKLFGYARYTSSLFMRVALSILNITKRVFSRPSGISYVFKRHVKQFIRQSALILPNSEEEAQLLLQFSGLPQSAHDKFRVVYNAVDPLQNQDVQLEKQDFLAKYNLPENYILQVGRIEYIKNQLNLLFALKDEPRIPIVFVGRICDRVYYKRLRQIADKRGNVYFIDSVEHREVGLFYKYAAVHVLLSLRESPGLVSLEALQHHCPIVTSTEAFLPVKTYFENSPYIANPFDIEEIRCVVLRAYTERHVVDIDFSKLSWNHVAGQTYEAYQEIFRA